MTPSFLRLTPASDLAEHVATFWFMSGSGPEALPDGHRILPDGSMEWVFQLGDPFRERGIDGRWRMQPHLLLVGQMERRVDVRPSGRIETVGVHFHPAGLAAFLEGDLSRFKGVIAPLETALGEALGSLVRRLKKSKTPEQMAAILEAFLRRRQLPGDPEMTKAASELSAPSKPIDVDAVARQFSLSERQFRRRFEAAVGLGPKRFSRLVRFQRVFEHRQEQDALVWSQVALECGYYDQAHFNRDFRAFTGVKPREIVKADDPLTAFFLSVSSKTARPRPR
jgi:AraC-like DNA-binding protein